MGTFEAGWAVTQAGDLVRNHYGTREIDDFGGQASSSGLYKELTIQFSYDDLPVAADGGNLEAKIPLGAQIVEAYIKASVPFAGGTSYDIGLQEGDGTEIDNNGIFAAVTLADVNAGAAGAGALVGGPATTGGDGYLVVAATGSFTAGEAELIVRYLDVGIDNVSYTAGGIRGAGQP